MNFNDLFRSIFGFSSRPHNYDMRDTLDGDEDDDFGTRHRDEDGFGDIHDKFFKETQEMFSHFQEMFSNFGFAEFPQIGFPEIEHGGSPRNEMLKSDEDNGDRKEEDSSERKSNWFSPSHQRPFFGDIFKIPSSDIDPHSSHGNREDTDLDEHIDSSNLDLILPKERNTVTSSPSGRRSFFHSVSVRTIRRPDGTVETHRTEKDSDGNVKTTTKTTDDNGRPTTIIDDGRPIIRRDRNNQDIPPLKDKQSESIFSKLFGSW